MISLNKTPEKAFSVFRKQFGVAERLLAGIVSSKKAFSETERGGSYRSKTLDFELRISSRKALHNWDRRLKRWASALVDYFKVYKYVRVFIM